MIDERDIFDDAEEEIKSLIDTEEIVNIDIEDINFKSKSEAIEMIDNLSQLYYDEDFLKRQPAFKKRVDSELESLRINLKMRKADEEAHDILLKNIGQNPNNASMYRSLTELQKTIVTITTKIEDSLTKLSNMMKGYQTEINFENHQDDETDQSHNPDMKTYKGSKAFIEAMSEES